MQKPVKTVKRQLLRIGSCALSALMVLGSIPAAAIDDGVTATYDEAYYAMTDYYGNLTDGSVVKSYRTNGSSTLTDYGDYEEVINLTEPVRKPTPAQPAEKDAPIPDLFGDARPAPQPGPRSLLDEAACLAPCGQGSRPTASTNELAIDDIVELGVPVAPVIQPATEKDTALPEPQEDTLPHVLPAGDGEAAAQEQPGPAIPETPEQEPALPTKDGQKGPLQDAEQESEASDEAIRALLTELDEALERAIQGEQSGDAQMVCQAAAHIGRLAEIYDLRVLDDPARCLEEVACSGNMDEIVQLMPDLVSAINRNRASFEEAERDG